jgi:hypothetical protein
MAELLLRIGTNAVESEQQHQSGKSRFSREWLIVTRYKHPPVPCLREQSTFKLAAH